MFSPLVNKVPLKDQLDILVQVVVFVEQLFCFFACLTAEVTRSLSCYS